MIAGATFLILGTAVAYVMLLAGALAGAFSQASANPATNKLIVEDVPAGERGVITGVKQSGVQVGIFFGGVTVPTVAITVGWRGAYLVVAVVPLIFAAMTVWVVPAATRPSVEHRTWSRDPLPAAIWWLAGFGFLMGFSAAVTYLVPLFAEETLGFSPVAGGIAAAVIVFVAVPGRILWSRFAERSGAFRGSLGAMAVLSIAAACLFYASGVVAVWLLWPAAVLIAVGSSSWNSVGMLAVMVKPASLRPVAPPEWCFSGSSRVWGSHHRSSAPSSTRPVPTTSCGCRRQSPPRPQPGWIAWGRSVRRS